MIATTSSVPTIADGATVARVPPMPMCSRTLSKPALRSRLLTSSATMRPTK